MKWLALFPLMVVIIAVQGSLFMPLSMWGVLPDLVLVFVAAVALVKGPVIGGLSGFATGFLVDVLGGRMIGLGALSKAVAGLTIGGVNRRVFGERRWVTVAFVFTAAIVDRSVYYWGARAFGVDFGFVDGVTRVILPSACYDALISVIMVPVYVRVIRWVADGGAPKKAVHSG